MKCVQDARCIEGFCGPLVRVGLVLTGLSYNVTVVCDSTVTVLCLCLRT